MKKWTKEYRQEYMKEYNKNYSKDKSKIVIKRWKGNNIEKVRQYNSNWVTKDYANYIYVHTKGKAKRLKIEFNLTKEDIIIPQYCPYTNIELTRIRGKGHIETNPSIDRIDPTKGYVRGNIQIISKLANTMKSNSSLETLITFAEGVLKRHARTTSS